MYVDYRWATNEDGTCYINKYTGETYGEYRDTLYDGMPEPLAIAVTNNLNAAKLYEYN